MHSTANVPLGTILVLANLAGCREGFIKADTGQSAQSEILYRDTDANYSAGTEIQSNAPLTEVQLSTTERFVIEPALPDGLSIDPTTGAITGVPRTDMATTEFSIKIDGSKRARTASIRMKISPLFRLDWSNPGPTVSGTCNVTIPAIVAPVNPGRTFHSAEAAAPFLSGVTATNTGFTGLLLPGVTGTFDTLWRVFDSDGNYASLKRELKVEAAPGASLGAIARTNAPSFQVTRGLQRPGVGCVQCDTGLLGSIAGNLDHTCALMADTTVRCWGSNAFGQLGDGTSGGTSATPVTVRTASGPLTGVKSVGAGSYFSCALMLDGTVNCWGRNASYQLGNASSTSSNVATPVSASSGTGQLSNVAQLSVGNYASCVVLSDATVMCWGTPGSYSLAEGYGNKPMLIPGLTGVHSVSSGYGHVCALLQTGQINCWGFNSIGQLGDGTEQPQSGQPPVNNPIIKTVSGINNALQVSAGNDGTCALLADRTVSCWGSYFLLNDGSTSGYRKTPVAVPGVSNVVSIESGPFRVCAVMANKTAQCWPEMLADPVPAFSNIVAITPHQRLHCALFEDGTIKCWDFFGAIDGVNDGWYPPYTVPMTGAVRRCTTAAVTFPENIP
ncbi:MAG: hypothetical protein RIQ81_303 [Pseudomonadota bacterium]